MLLSGQTIAPNQYKCKENFVHLFKIKELLNVKIVHYFAVKDNFNGVWDGAGKVVKNFLWRLEQEHIRSPTAFDCFINTKMETLNLMIVMPGNSMKTQTISIYSRETCLHTLEESWGSL
jgi:hypothetical protein